MRQVILQGAEIKDIRFSIAYWLVVSPLEMVNTGGKTGVSLKKFNFRHVEYEIPIERVAGNCITLAWMLKQKGQGWKCEYDNFQPILVVETKSIGLTSAHLGSFTPGPIGLPQVSALPQFPEQPRSKVGSFQVTNSASLHSNCKSFKPLH